MRNSAPAEVSPPQDSQVGLSKARKRRAGDPCKGLRPLIHKAAEKACSRKPIFSSENPYAIGPGAPPIFAFVPARFSFSGDAQGSPLTGAEGLGGGTMIPSEGG